MNEAVQPTTSASNIVRQGPLSRFTVLDLTHARSGPSCVRTFADWGANVIRVEQPPTAEELDEVVGKRDGSDFQNLHRNKRAITLNLKTAEGKEIFLKLVEQADLVIENMRPGVAKRLGVDFDSVRKRNRRIVYGSISGFGQDGPYAERPCLDQVAQGMSGIMSVTGLPGQGPVRVGVAVTDLVSGAFLAQGLLIALLERDISGEGRWVQTSLIEAGIALLDFQASRWLMSEELPAQEGNYHPTVTPTGLYATADGFLNLSASGNRIFRKFCQTIGSPGMIDDPRFASSEARAQNRAALNEAISTILSTKSTQHWFDALNSQNIPCGPVYNVQQVFADPQVQHVGIVQSVQHERLGETRLVGQPFTIMGYDRSLRSPTPALGQHTAEVLEAVGYDQATQQEFRDKRAI